jgi:GGDEF domain-containing protein
MISIKRFMNRSEEEAIVWQALYLLLEKIGSEAVPGDPAELGDFTRNLQRAREAVADATTPETLMVAVGSAAQAMSGHRQLVSRFIERQRREIQTMVSMLTKTVARLSGDNTHFGQSFREIGDRLENAVALADLHEIKSRLSECLQDFNDETRKQKAETEEMIAALQKEVDRCRESSGPLLDADPATGLLRQDAAESAMFKSITAGTRNYVVTVVVNRMQSINARFGYQVGDQVLRTCTGAIEKQLSPGDQMFRWSGPALVLVLQRNEPLETVRAQLKRILDVRIEETYSLGSRSVLLPITTSWTAVKLIAPVGLVVKQIQAFIASQSPRDFA